MLARNMTAFHNLVLVCVVAMIGYGGLYGADSDRDPGREAAFLGIPVRFVSVMIVAFGAVMTLAYPERLVVTFRAVSVGSAFSTVGAVTTDSLF